MSLEAHEPTPLSRFPLGLALGLLVLLLALVGGALAFTTRLYGLRTHLADLDGALTVAPQGGGSAHALAEALRARLAAADLPAEVVEDAGQVTLRHRAGDGEQVRLLATTPGVLRFALVAPDLAPGRRDAILAAPAADPRYEVLPGDDGTPLVLDLTWVVGPGVVERAQPVLDADGLPALQLTLTEAGAAALGDLTERWTGAMVAIVLDGRVLCAPTVRSRIGREVVVTGGRGWRWTPEELERLRPLLSHPLPGPAVVR